MKNKKFIWITAPIVAVLLFVFLIQAFVYEKRGVRGRFKSATDDIGNNFAATNGGQYEPYYLTTNYSVAREDVVRAESKAPETLVPQQRKLIQKAELSLEVKSSQETLQRINDLVSQASGILISSHVQKYGQVETGQAIIKIQPKQLGAAMLVLKKLGRVDLERSTGEDVTEEYVDLSIRLSNSKHVRERLLKILEASAGSVKDILEVERELARIGEGIERLEGRMKFIDTQAAMATITINFYERQPVSVDAIDIVKKFKDTLRKAFVICLDTFNAGIMVIAALLPITLWLGAIASVVLIGRKIIRKKM